LLAGATFEMLKVAEATAGANIKRRLDQAGRINQ
jgi:hypothetical protein